MVLFRVLTRYQTEEHDKASDSENEANDVTDSSDESVSSQTNYPNLTKINGDITADKNEKNASENISVKMGGSASNKAYIESLERQSAKAYVGELLKALPGKICVHSFFSFTHGYSFLIGNVCGKLIPNYECNLATLHCINVLFS